MWFQTRSFLFDMLLKQSYCLFNSVLDVISFQNTPPPERMLRYHISQQNKPVSNFIVTYFHLSLPCLC